MAFEYLRDKSNMLKQQTPCCPHIFQQLNWFCPFVALLYLFGAVLYSMINAPSAHALTSGVTVTSITPYAALDHNNSCSIGPRGMYLQVNVQNTTGATLTGLSANISSFSDSSFTLDSGESATRYIGNLSANQTTSLYWYVNYPCNSGTFTGSGPTTNYTVTLSDSTPGTITSSTFTLTTRANQSSPAGGAVASASIGLGAVPGQIIPYTVNYTFGNPSSVADAMIQPAGNVSFDSSCYRLISTDITASEFSAGLITSNDNRLYFTGVSAPSGGGSTKKLTVVYNFISLCSGNGTTASPFATLTSGGPQKYTNEYGGTSFTFPNSTNPFTITKSASSTTLAAGGTVTYTVTINNPSSYAAIIDRITDTLPPNVTYGSLVTGTGNTSSTITNDSSSQPATGATGVINWLGNANTSYSLPAGGSLTLKYTANVPNVVGSYANSATTTTGSSTIGPATTTVSVGISDLTLTKTHTGNFSIGTPGSYALTVNNIGTAPSTGTITVTDTLPGGLTIPNGAVTLTGTNAANWSCSAASNVITCSSTNAIAVGGSSTFNLTGIQIGAAAAPSVTNNAVVAGGNEANVSNNTATDLTNVKVSPTIDLDGNNSSGATGNDFKTSFALGGSAIGVVDANTSSDETLDTVITDSDSTQLSKAEIKLINAQTNDLLTVSGSLPTGITLDPSSTATQIILTGTATRANYETALEQIRFSTTSNSLSDRTITVQVTDDTSLVSNLATATITIAASPISPLAGQLVINEVLYAQSTSGTIGADKNDEFIELFNASSSSINLSGLKLFDGNLLAVGDPNAKDENFNGTKEYYTFGEDTSIESGNLTLQPGQYAVVWIGAKNSGGSQIAGRFASDATFQAWLGQTPKLNNAGDDVWLYDANTKIIDYMAYGLSSSGAINTRPNFNIWNSTYENKLDDSLPGQSISLTPNGIDGNSSACWEKTAILNTNPDSASGRCTGFLNTIDTDIAFISPNQRITSVGRNNNQIIQDYGDAPVGYEGLDAARHALVSNLNLGDVFPDAETAAQSSANANGDNAVAAPNVNDEEGISTFPTLKTDATSYSLAVKVNNPNSGAAKVYGWIDFDRDSEFDVDERATVSNGSITLDSDGKVPNASNGTVTLTWSNLGGTGADIIIGNSYARIRLTTDLLTSNGSGANRDSASIGAANNGEVEDYPIAIASDGNRPLGSPFTCNSTFYITTGSGIANPQSLYDVNRSGSTYTFTQRGPSTSVTNGYPNTFSYNALAYNPVDNYLYAFVTGSSAPTGVYAVGNVVKIGSDGILRSIGKPIDGSGGTLPITNYYSATMLSDGTYVIGQASSFAKLNVATSPPTILSTGSVSGVNFTDFAVDPTDPTSLSGAKIYGINEGDGTNHLVILNVAGNNPTIVSQATNSTGFGDNAGSQFVDSFGTLYYRSSTNNSLYRIDSDPNSPNYGQATLITTTPGGGYADGASCLFSAIMQKEVQDTAGNIITTSPANKVVKYVYSIVSGNVQNLTGVSFQDDLRTVANGNPINGTFTGTYTVSNGSGTVSFSNNNQTIQINNLVIPAQTQATSGADKLTITAAVKVAKTLTPGTYFNQSSITNLPSTYPSSIPSDYPLSPAYQDPTPLEITEPIASDPKLLLVKRITAINPGQPDAIQFDNFVNDGSTTDDEAPNWPDSDGNPSNNINTHLSGATIVPAVKPGDEVEYTIYFLSTGDINAKSVNICDAVPDYMTFVKNTYGVELGIGLGFDSTTIPLNPNLKLSNLLNDDQGDFYAPGTAPPANLCKKVTPGNTLVDVNGTNNDNGAVVVKIQDLPKADTPGVPTNSYGFIRFRAKVK
jgi:uncharacterized repeat protein (TIGR01451 family)